MAGRGTARMLAAVAVLAGLAACGDAVDEVEQRTADVADQIAQRGIGAVAEGRWRCETDEVDDGPTRRLITLVSIASDGRFSFVGGVVAEGATDDAFLSGAINQLPQSSGTWEVDGLELRVSIPWDSEGSNGFYGWTYQADAEAPTHLSGTTGSPDGEQELDVELVGLDEIRLVQHDVEGSDGPNYDWDVTCTRTSSDPGEILPTVPPSDGGD